MKIKLLIFISILLGTLLTLEAQATTFDDIGFTRLKTELGTSTPDGTGVKTAQIEAAIDTDPSAAVVLSWIPNAAAAQFTSKTLTEVSTGSAGVSAHADSVARFFYGNTLSTAPGVSNIDLFETIHWLTTGFLRAGEVLSPNVSATRVANHSWVTDAGVSNADVLRRVDFVVEQDEFIQVAASNTNPATTHLLADSFNAIKVSVPVSTGSVTDALDSTYAAGRARADILAPESTLSGATPRVASAAALLVGHAHSNPTLTSGSASTNNRNGDTVYNAERSEAIKAILMAGADRNTVGNTNSIDITDYRVEVTNQTNNGLDTRFGAGQINIYNSYHVLNAGEQNSAEDLPTGAGAIGNVGFDYDPAFGGLNSSSATATYNFTTSANAGQKLKASLVWNLQVAASDILYDLDLQLIDVTVGDIVVANSTSTIDNTENIWFDLASNNVYQLKVIPGAGQAAFEWDYALAWQIVVPGITVVETDSTTVTAEDGATDTFTVALNSPPAGDVTIYLASSDTGEGTVSPSNLTFTSANWSALQTVTVTGVNDAVDDGDKNYSINFIVSSVDDANYNGSTLPSVSVSNKDDDATFSFTDQADVALNTLITSNTVVVTGLLGTTAISVADGEYSINGDAYTSTNGNISNTNSVTLRTTSSITGSTSVNVALTIGDVGDIFSVTTEIDTDGDGVVDSVDAFPNDPNETADTDADGVGDNADAFPTNIAASLDADNDGKPETWNASCDVACQDNSGLTLDVATSSTSSTSGTSGGDGSLSLIWLLLPVLITAGRRRVS